VAKKMHDVQLPHEYLCGKHITQVTVINPREDQLAK